MAQTVVKTGATAISGNTLVYSSATAAIYGALIDLTPMAADTVLNNKVANCTIVASGLKVVTQDNFSGVQTDPMFMIPAQHSNKGFSITIVKSSGTTPTVPFEITTF